MKDVEIVASLLLLLEEGVKGYSTDGIDEAFASRDVTWPAGVRLEDEYRRTIVKLREILSACPPSGWPLIGTRLANQADFYSLFGAVAELNRQKVLPEPQAIVAALSQFVGAFNGLDLENGIPAIVDYYKAARSNSNDKGQREIRIRIVKDVLLGALSRPVERGNGS